MEVLNIKEIQQVSGGVDALTLTIGGLAVANLAWSFAQQASINMLQDDTDLLFIMSLYTEAQLSMLPHYDTVQNSSPQQLITYLWG